MQQKDPDSLGTPAAELAHELNNILAVIRVNLRLAERELGPANAAAQSLAEIESACTRVEALVSGLRGGARKAAPATPAPAPGPQAHILFLDDDEALVFLAQRLLQRMGHRVSTFTRADEALAAVRRDPWAFELVVSDLNLLGGSGFDLAREMLALRKDLPLVLVSGYVTDALRERARELGPVPLLAKPSSVEEFARLVHERTRARS